MPNPIGYGPAIRNYGLSNYVDPNAFSQYGVVPSQPGAVDGLSSLMSGLSDINGILGTALGGPLGSLIGAGTNFLGQMFLQHRENEQQKAFYGDFMSPQARMRDMREAGINTNLAAEGIAGASAPAMNAAGAPPASNPDLASVLGDSENVRLQQDLIASQINKTDKEANLIGSQDVEQRARNMYAERMQAATLSKLKNDDRISRSTANMLEEDEYYHGAEAFEHYKQTIISTETMKQEFMNLQADFFNKCAEYQLLLLEQGKTKAETAELWSRVGLNGKMIEEIDHRIKEIDANTALTKAKTAGQRIENDIMGFKREYEGYANKILRQTGFDMRSPANMTFLRLCAEGKTGEAQKFMGNLYDYSKGQYGAKSNETRRWINTAITNLMAVAGVVMLFVPGLQPAGAVVLGGSFAKGAYDNASGTAGRGYSYSYDAFDNGTSHIPE